MFRPYDLNVGRALVMLARKAITEYVVNGVRIRPSSSDVPESLFKDNYGVFTTIEMLTDSETYELRGCIGFPRGYNNVVDAVIESAIAAATQDPRFEPLRRDELDKIVIEVSILSPLEELRVRSPKEYLSRVVVGVHGLVVQRGLFSGLLLPQVPVEYCWDTIMFLNETCVKAFLPPNCWLDEETRVYVYEAQIFRELKPGGDVVERDLIDELKRRCSRDAR